MPQRRRAYQRLKSSSHALHIHRMPGSPRSGRPLGIDPGVTVNLYRWHGAGTLRIRSMPESRDATATRDDVVEAGIIEMSS